MTSNIARHANGVREAAEAGQMDTAAEMAKEVRDIYERCAKATANGTYAWSDEDLAAMKQDAEEAEMWATPAKVSAATGDTQEIANKDLADLRTRAENGEQITLDPATLLALLAMPERAWEDAVYAAKGTNARLALKFNPYKLPRNL